MEANLTSYHPPLSFLLAKVLAFAGGLSTTQASQLVSFASLLGAFVLLRQILRRIGLLHTLLGITFLYISAALPVFVELSISSTYDSLTLFLGVLTLYLSVDLFWDPATFSLRKPLCQQKLVLLFGVFVLGLLTKYSCLLHLSFPFFVVAVRSNYRQLLRQSSIAFMTCALAVATVIPFYYQRYYLQTGDWMPMGMDWVIPNQLQTLRSERDAHRVTFLLHMMRIPFAHFLGDTPVVDSLPHEVWFHTWKSPPIFTRGGSLRFLPDMYVHLFLPLFLFGFVSFLLRHRHRGTALSDFTWILTGCAFISFIALLSFGYEYPYFPWNVFKAKYVPMVVLWICFLCAQGITAITKINIHYKWEAIASSVALSFISMMVVLNHTIIR